MKIINLLKHLKWMGIIIIMSIITTHCQTEKTQKKPIVIAHRGASGYLPEHTLASKAMAYAFYPDFIEQDVVLTKDDVPIVIHDIHLETVTDVAQVFPERKRADGKYYAIDFTFDEIRRLRVTERFNPETGKAVFDKRFPLHQSYFMLHSLQEEIELIQGLNKSTGHRIGIYPEIKEPAFHRGAGKDISKIVLEVLKQYGYENKDDLCYLQCFDAAELQRVRDSLNSHLTLIQLIEHDEEISQIPHYAQYAQGIGPAWKMLKNQKLMELAEKNKLMVHIYTLRADQLASFATFDEMVQDLVLHSKVDGLFTDHPDQVIEIINRKK